MLLFVFAAVAHAALAFRTGAVSYEVPVAIGWVGALLVLADRREAFATSRGERALGLFLAAAGFAGAAFWSGEYRSPLRLTPMLLGAGLLLWRYGARGLWRSGRELLLLALPIFTPPPIALRSFLEPQRATIAVTSAFLRLIGHPASVAGDVLSVPGGGIRVLAECSGLNCISQLLALALLLVCLFQTARLQKLGIFAAALAAGFFANCSRLALLALLSRDDWPAFELWHGATGELRFTCAGLLVCGAAWWLLLRRRDTAPLPAQV